MSMAWVKLHTDILGDPKLVRAARKGAVGLELLPWLLAFAGKADDGGRLTVNGEPVEPEDLAPLIPGADVGRVVACVASLINIGVLVVDDDGAPRFAAWADRTAKPSDRPQAIAERVKRHRAAKHDGQHEGVTPRNALHVTTDNATEVEVEEEGEEKDQEHPPTPHAGASAPAGMAANGNGHHPAPPPPPVSLRIVPTPGALAPRPGEEPRPDPTRAADEASGGGKPKRGGKGTATGGATLVPTGDEARVLAAYKRAHPLSRPGGDEQVRVIRRALAAGYTPDDLAEAIQGNAEDDWHRANGKHGVTYVLRNRDTIDDFRGRYAKAHRPLRETNPELYAAMGGV